MTKNEIMRYTSVKDFTCLIVAMGYQERKSTSTHRIFTAPNRPALVVPAHNGNKGTIATGTLRNLAKLIESKG
jgi:predicted RNA binding protein YcfA (HicA-like mRNA interferase family)